MIVIKNYRCPKCGEYEVDENHNETHKKCKICKKEKVERLLTAPIVAKDGEPRTVGSLIDRNNKRNPLTREKQFGDLNSKKLEKQSRFNKINKLSPEQKKTFIETGRLP